MKDVDFDFDPGAFDDAESRAFRAKLRALVEEHVSSQEDEGVITHWVLAAEFASHDAGGPCGTFFMDYGDFNDYGSVSWTVKGLLQHALDELRNEV